MSLTARVLLIEDSRTFGYMVQGVLEELAGDAYELKITSSARQAADTAGTFNPDLILLNPFLPNSQGLDTIGSMQEAFPGKPIVVISDKEDEETAFQAISAGAQDYLVESETNPKALKKAVRYALERKRIEEELLRSQKLVQSILDSIQAGIVIIDPADHKIIEANPVALAMIGAPAEQVLGSVCHKFICPAEVGKCPVTDLGQKVDNAERVLLTTGGQKRPILKTVASVNLEGRERLIESFLDITALKNLQDELLTLSITDELTRIANRRHFMQIAAMEAKRTFRYGHPMSVIIFDIDHFKVVNDTYGHPAGDQVLRQMAQLAQHDLRDSDLLGRLGGEEFGIVLLETGLEEGVKAAERLRRKIADHVFVADDDKITCTISLGVAAFVPGVDDLESWLKRADKALYLAKDNGRDRVEALEP